MTPWHAFLLLASSVTRWSECQQPVINLAVFQELVFIDSDYLQDLDRLFRIVAEHTQQLVVYLTDRTLTRPWCLGEIATAFVSAGKAKSVYAELQTREHLHSYASEHQE
jgi:hypothetical protein